MANIVRVEAQALLNASNAQATYTNPTSPLKLALTTTSPSTTAAGTKVSGGSYADQTIAYGAGSAADPPVATNSGTLTYSNMPAATVTSLDEYDSAGTPIRRWFGPLTASKTTNSGDTLTIAAAAISKSLG
jgi:hypothetical protein